jgi:hypothetical protein
MLNILAFDAANSGRFVFFHGAARAYPMMGVAGSSGKSPPSCRKYDAVYVTVFLLGIVAVIHANLRGQLGA